MFTANKHSFNAFRLYKRIRHEHTYYRAYHQITVTPKGKGKTLDETWQAFRAVASTIKGIVDVFLIAETENTNHFHGVIVVKNKKLKCAKLYNKKHAFTCFRSDAPMDVWITYMFKGKPNILYTLPGNMLFSQIFQTDVSV